MERMDRRKFLASSAVFGGGVLLAGCGGGAGSQPSAGGTPTETHPPIGQEPGTLNILEWPGYEAGGTKAQTYGMLAGKSYTDEFGAEQPQVRRHRQRQPGREQGAPGRVRPDAPLHRLRPGLRQRGPRAAVGHQPAAELQEPLPGADRARQGQRPAVLDPVGLGLLQHPVPQGQGRRGRRDRLGALLEREVQGQDLDVGRRLDAGSRSPACSSSDPPEMDRP